MMISQCRRPEGGCARRASYQLQRGQHVLADLEVVEAADHGGQRATAADVAQRRHDAVAVVVDVEGRPLLRVGEEEEEEGGEEEGEEGGRGWSTRRDVNDTHDGTLMTFRSV